MIDHITISILANIAVKSGKYALKKILKSDELETQINQAFKFALKKWSVNQGIRRRETIWTTQRLTQLIAYLENPSDSFQFDKSTLKLITYFYEELQNQTTAWHFIQAQQFKILINKLNAIPNRFDEILEELKKEKLQPETVIDTLKEQTRNQIKKQIVTEKYIPNTFIETDEFKDYLRYFVSPFTFYPKIFNETLSLDFSHLNRIKKINKEEPFCFNVTDFNKDISKFSYYDLYSHIDKLINYLNERHAELDKNRTYYTYSFTWKIESKNKALKYINYKTLLLTDNAGQGKTNLLCDLAENVLLKRNIPTIFLSGYEIDASNISKSISQKLFPNDDFSFRDIFKAIESYADKTQLILIIDGINENTNPKLFSKNLEIFLQSINNKDFIKVIITCRSEYFKNNFENLLKSSFKENIRHIDGLNNRLNKIQKKKLYHAYLSYFKIKISNINKEIQNQLVDDFLLLRIFSEVNKGKHLPNVNHIYKTDLFSEYYKLKINEINVRLSKNDEFNVKGKFDIRNFVENIASYMITYQTFYNIPLNEIIKNDANKDIYIRFLDENIILRKELVKESELIFENNEVINFTFDGFRDYIISNYLISKLFKKSNTEFEDFITNNLKERSPILEGCSIFLYSLSRKKKNAEINSFIKKQPWFNTAFLNVIFSTPDNDIIEEDKVRIKEIFTLDQNNSEKIIIELAYKRYDDKKYPNLNINLLFEIFRDLSAEQYDSLVYPIYQKKYYGDRHLEQLLEQLNKFLEKFDEGYHKLFKYILYFLPLSDKVEQLYKRYYDSHLNNKQLGDILECKNEKLTDSIKIFNVKYEIQI